MSLLHTKRFSLEQTVSTQNEMRDQIYYKQFAIIKSVSNFVRGFLFTQTMIKSKLADAGLEIPRQPNKKDKN